MRKLFSKIKRFFTISKYARKYGMTRKEYKQALNSTIDVSSFYPKIIKKLE